VVKDLAMSTVGNLAALMHTPAHDEVLKNTFANFAFEHYEIAAYKSLLTLADLTGQPSAISMLERSLAEEEAMAKWIADHLEETTTTFVRRTEAGETAGV
jgi:ferritin-like metal-binding protein YciE